MTKAEIALIRSLADKKERYAQGLFVAEGEKLVAEIAASGFTVRKIYRMSAEARTPAGADTATGTSVSGAGAAAGTGKAAEGNGTDAIGAGGAKKSAAGSAGFQAEAARDGTARYAGPHRADRNTGGTGAQTETVSPKEMERISMLKTPAGVLALVDIPRYRAEPGPLGRELTLALDNIQDPGNLGTIIRIADWFGIRDILCSESSADCFNPKVVQATMGAITRVRVHYHSLEKTFAEAASAGIPLYGTFLDGENIYHSGLSRGGILVMGSEGRGISPAIEALITRRLYIPPYPAGEPSSESLNVAVATAVACSEFRRRM